MSAVIGLRVGPNSRDTWNDSQLRIDTTHTAIYTVIMTNGVGLTGGLNEAARENTVANVLGVPRIGTDSPILPGAVCVDREINEVGPATWEVTATFDNKVKKAAEAFDGDEEREPWDLEPTWSWGSETIEVPMTYEVPLPGDDPRAITASTGEPLGVITKPISVPVLTIRRAELSFDRSVITSYTNRTNSSPFWDADEEFVLCSSIVANPEKKYAQKYWMVEYVFKFSPLEEGWKFRAHDEGTYYWSDPEANGPIYTGGIKKPFGDDAFQQTIGNLDGFGGRNTTGTPAFVDPAYRRYPTANFNSLSLGPWVWA
jgi:hypothetical protein